MSTIEDYRGMIASALECLPAKAGKQVLPVLRALFDLIYEDLQLATAGNPLEHHLIVLDHMMRIAVDEGNKNISFKRAAAVALLHDVSPAEKITRAMIKVARQESPQKAEVLELRRQQLRLLHMREGSAMAHKRMLDLNALQGAVVFDADDMDAICETIRIHDNPSLDIIIPRTNWLAVAFREADRLWMVTDDGIKADLVRKERTVTNDACLAQLESNIGRFREERGLYWPREATEGPFRSDDVFFRTKAGQELFEQLERAARARYSGTSGSAPNSDT